VSDIQRIKDALTSIHHAWEIREKPEGPLRLLEVLKSRLPHLEEQSWGKRISWGGVFVNGRTADSDRELEVPCLVEYFEPKFDISRAETVFPPFSTDYVIFEDEHLLFVFKPAGLPSLPVREQKHHNLRDYLLNYTGSKIHIPSRIDTSTQGLTVVSKTPQMHPYLQRIFEKRRVQKFYLLEVAQRVAWPGRTVDASIARDGTHPVLRKTVNEGGKKASTTFESLYFSEFKAAGAKPLETSILLARPLSGRTHQIRVHAQSIGLPIIGDNFYGGLAADCLHLLSYRLCFQHPLSRQELDIRVPPELLPGWLDPARLSI